MEGTKRTLWREARGERESGFFSQRKRRTGASQGSGEYAHSRGNDGQQGPRLSGGASRSMWREVGPGYRGACD